MEIITQKFDGYVTSVNREDGIFVAIICDLTNPENPDEEAEIYLNILPEEDQAIIEDGHLIFITLFEDEENDTFRSEVKIQRRNRKEQAEFKKHLRKSKKRAAIMSKKLQTMFE
jgi:hypothetical protein